MPLYHAIPCFQIVFAMFIIQFNASTPPAVIAPLANGAWCRILGLWEALLQQICMSHIVAWYMLAILTMSSYFLTSSFALDCFTIFSYGWCHNPGGTCGEVNRFMKYSWIFNMEYMEYMDQYCGFRFFPVHGVHGSIPALRGDFGEGIRSNTALDLEIYPMDACEPFWTWPKWLGWSLALGTLSRLSMTFPGFTIYCDTM